MRVLILGLGVNQGGVGSARFFAQRGDEIKVTDLKNETELKSSLDQLKNFENISYHLGEHRFEDIDWADLIIRNPAIKPNNIYLKYAKEKGKRVEMDMGIFLEYVRSDQIIGVTGTKGKSTTATLIYEILKTKYPQVLFAGNIGKSVLDTVPYIKSDSLIVLELSSFQLQAWEEHKISPKYSVITNIYPDHLNYHSSMEEYIEIKRTISKYQKGDSVTFIRAYDPVTDTPEFLNDLPGEIIKFSKDDLPKDYQPNLPGEHNLENIAAAISVSDKFGIEEEKALGVAKSFKGVEFRLQLIYDRDGVRIYNDTTATSPNAAIEALKSLPGCILIAGGMNKGLNYIELSKAINNYAKEVYFLTGDATDEMINKINIPKYGPFDNLQTLLAKINQSVKPNTLMLFSPGATSYNLFQNEFDRGRQFNKAVKNTFG